MVNLINVVDYICEKRGEDRNDFSVSLIDRIIEAENEKNMDTSNDPTRFLKGSSKSLLAGKEGAIRRAERRNSWKRGRKGSGAKMEERNLMETKMVESEETMVDPSLEEKFLVSILEESGMLKATSKELLSIQMNVLRKSVHISKDRISEQEHEDDENLVENTAEHSKEKMADFHGEEKKEGEASKEERAEETVADEVEARSNDLEADLPKEKEENVGGTSADANSLKNENATESTIFLSRS